MIASASSLWADEGSREGDKRVGAGWRNSSQSGKEPNAPEQRPLAEAAFMLGRRREVKWDVVVCRRGGGNKQQHPREEAEEEEPNLRSAEERKGGARSLPFPPFASYEIPFA